MLRKASAVVLCGAIFASGCASAGGPRPARAPSSPVSDQGLLADYVQRIPAGSRVRVERSNGDRFKGTLMKATPDAIIVQKNTPEAPVTVPLGEVSRVTLDAPGAHSTALHVWAGVGIAFTGLFLIGALLTAAAGGA
jgi:hypothetical protein